MGRLWTGIGLLALALILTPGPRAAATDPGALPASGSAFDPGPLDGALLDDPAPPIPQRGVDPLESIIDEPGPAESVIGPDGRSRITATTSYPSSAIGQLTFTQRGSAYLCTGFLIDPNTVLTAGHCVHEGGAGGVYSQNVLFTPGRNGATAPFGSCGAEAVEASPEWLATATEEGDYGWVQLDCLIGELVGWFGYTATGDVTGATAEVRGYPGDRPPGTMWTMGGSIAQVDAALAFYAMDTFGGQSGSPVYDPDRPSCGGPCALAVHGYGLHGAAPHDTYNHGIRIDETRAAAIAVIAAANDRTDDTPPTITVTSPGEGTTLAEGALVAAAYRCADEPTGSGLRSCEGTVDDGALLDTTVGTHTFSVEAEDGAGNVAGVAFRYEVVAAPPARSGPGPVSATPPFTG